MSNKPKSFKPTRMLPTKVTTPILPMGNSPLDVMRDGREFESLLRYQLENVDIIRELKKSIKEVEAIRKKPLICYFANMVAPRKTPVSIDDVDDLPFREMVATVPDHIKDIDVAIVTPGGSAQQVASFVNTLRKRFENVDFLLLDKAMSAGTIFALSGDNIIMSTNAQIGPIDPQVRNGDGYFVPAQAILTIIQDIKDRGDKLMSEGKKPDWTDLHMLSTIDKREVGNALSMSEYSIKLVEEYLAKYKFRTWLNHRSTGLDVTEDERKMRAKEIAKNLCSHSVWKTHSHGISREVAHDVCRLKIIHPETIAGLDRAMRRMWAFLYWSFENSNVNKIFASDNYSIIRSERTNVAKP